MDGMDAAAKPVAAPVTNIDQVAVKIDANVSVSAKSKSSDIKDQAGGAGAIPKKNRPAPNPTTFEKMMQPQDDDLSEKVVRDAVERANRALSGSDRKFEISTHEKTKEIMIKVLDTNTNEVIREIPPRKIVDLVVRLCEMAGILYDEKG